MRGPKPTPRNLRVIRGSDRPCRINPDEPEVEVSIPKSPKHLTRREKWKFRQTAKLLAGMRVMSESDIDALAMYAVSWCRWLDANEKLADGDLVVTTRTGRQVANPYLAIANKAQRECLSILTEFGLTPSSRTRVNKL